MRPFKLGLVAVILNAALLYSAGINDQIEAIHNAASSQERVELMNKLKLQLASMNGEERLKAINMLQTNMGGPMCATTSQMPMNNYQKMQQMPQNIIMQRQMGNTNSPMMSPMGGR